MEKQIFTIKDLQEFLKTNDIEWSGKIYNFNSQTPSTPSNRDFDEVQLFICKDDKTGKYFDKEILASNCQLLTFLDYPIVENDLSVDWCEFLLKKYGKEFAKISFNWSIKRMAEIKKESSESIAEFTRIENEKAKNQIEKINNFAKSTIKYLTSDDIDEVVGSTDIF